MLNRIRVDSDTYNDVLTRYKKYVERDDISKYFTRGYSNKPIIKLDKENNAFIVQGYRLGKALDSLSLEGWQQLVCVLDDSLDGVEEVNTLPYANQANSVIKKLLKKYYKDAEIESILTAHSVSEEDKEKIIHSLLPEEFHDGKIHKFTNCAYYDINGAHTDALCEMFPLAKNDLVALHHNGGKDYINIFVGDLCNNNHRETFNWIVKRTRKKLEDIRKKAGGKTIYANTDGIILWHSREILETNDEIGQIKSESKDGIVYAYCCEGDAKTTRYTIYQYEHPKKGKKLKGNSRLIIRKGMDLSKGIVNKGKIRKDDLGIEYIENFRTEEIEIYEE